MEGRGGCGGGGGWVWHCGRGGVDVKWTENIGRLLAEFVFGSKLCSNSKKKEHILNSSVTVTLSCSSHFPRPGIVRGSLYIKWLLSSGAMLQTQIWTPEDLIEPYPLSAELPALPLIDTLTIHISRQRHFRSIPSPTGFSLSWCLPNTPYVTASQPYYHFIYQNGSHISDSLHSIYHNQSN